MAAFNASLMIFGVLLACMESQFAGLFTPTFIAEMRSNLDKAVDVLHGLDNGNIMISRCRDCLKRLLDIYDSMHASPADVSELGSSSRFSAQPSRLSPLSAAQTLGTASTSKQYGSNRDLVFSPLGGSFDASSFDMDMGFGGFGGLVMSSDFEFLNGS